MGPQIPTDDLIQQLRTNLEIHQRNVQRHCAEMRQTTSRYEYLIEQTRARLEESQIVLDESRVLLRRSIFVRSRMIAIVDADATTADMMADLFTDEGYQVRSYANSASLLNGLARQLPGLLILDLHLEHATSGWEILREIRSMYAMPVIVMTTDNEFASDQLEQLRRLNATVMYKPFHLQPLLAAVTTAICP